MNTQPSLSQPVSLRDAFARAAASPQVTAQVLGAAKAAAYPLRWSPLPSSAASADSFAAAAGLYEQAQWVPAFEMAARLADAGNVPAAKLALLMLRYGESLYAVRLIASPKQIALWARHVLRAKPAQAATFSLRRR